MATHLSVKQRKQIKRCLAPTSKFSLQEFATVVGVDNMKLWHHLRTELKMFPYCLEIGEKYLMLISKTGLLLTTLGRKRWKTVLTSWGLWFPRLLQFLANGCNGKAGLQDMRYKICSYYLRVSVEHRTAHSQVRPIVKLGDKHFRSWRQHAAGDGYKEIVQHYLILNRNIIVLS